MRLAFWKPKAYNETSGLDAVTAKIWADAFGGIHSKAGVKVNASTALSSNAIAACIAIRSRTMGSLPAHIYKVGTHNQTDHQSSVMFTNGPNDYMTWGQLMKLREMMVILTGNFYCRKKYKYGRVIGLEPLYGAVRLKMDNGTLSYLYDPISGPEEVFAPSQLWHSKFDILTADGLLGRSVVELAREAIGLDISAEEFLGRVLANGTHMGTVLVTPNILTKEQYDGVVAQLADGRGVTPAGTARIMQNGLKPEVLGMNLQEADLETQRRYINEKISAICGVPLSLMNDMEHATYTNSEQQDLGYSKHNIMPTCVSVEQELNGVLFAGQDAGKFYIKLDLRGLQRGAFKERMDGYEIGIRMGLWSPNECRAWEDMDPYDGGDKYVMMAQLTTVEKIGEDPPPPLTLVPNEEKAAAALGKVAADAAERIRIRARIDAEKKRDPEATREWARTILAPIACAYDTAGLAFDVEAAITSALGG